MNTSLVLTSFADESRVYDLDLAQRLGFKKSLDIRKLIKRYEAKLLNFGVLATVEKTSGSLGGRPTFEFYLNQKQAIFICMKAETDKAIESQIEIALVFDAHLRGALTALPSSAELNALIDARIQLALGVPAPSPKPLSALPRPDAHQRVLDYIRPLTEVVVADVQQDAAPDLSRVAIGKVIHRAGWTGKTCWRGTGAMRVWFAPMALH